MKETKREMRRVQREKRFTVAEWFTAKFLQYLSVASGIELVVVGCSVAEPYGVTLEGFKTLVSILLPTVIVCNVFSHYLTYHLWKKGLISRKKVVRLIHRRYNLSGMFN